MRNSFDFESLVDLCSRTHEELRGRAARAADTGLAARNWLFGWYIVEYEQNGDDRAEYGKRLIDRLSEALRTAAVRGASPTNLRKFRGFYRAYPQIHQTPSAESVGPSPDSSTAIQQTLSVESLVAFPGSSHARQLIAGVIEGVRLGHVLIDLKRDKPTHQDLGQMQMYVNYFDRHVKLDDELPTVGIVLCGRKNDALVELTRSKDVGAFGVTVEGRLKIMGLVRG